MTTAETTEIKELSKTIAEMKTAIDVLVSQMACVLKGQTQNCENHNQRLITVERDIAELKTARTTFDEEIRDAKDLAAADLEKTNRQVSGCVSWKTFAIVNGLKIIMLAGYGAWFGWLTKIVFDHLMTAQTVVPALPK